MKKLLKKALALVMAIVLALSVVVVAPPTEAQADTTSYYLDVNGWINGEKVVSGMQFRFDVYINGKKVKTNVNDYYTEHSPGTTFKVVMNSATTGYELEETPRKVDQYSILVYEGTMPNHRVNLYVVANTIYYITYNSNGGSGSMDTQKFLYTHEQELTANAFTRDGYTFTGWNTKADGSGTSYTDAQSVVNLSSDPNGKITLYAQWEMNDVTVTPYTGDYDQAAHDVATVEGLPSDATITYGTTEGTYNLTSMPQKTDAGEYTYYYKISASGMEDVTGSFTCVINKIDAEVDLSMSSASVASDETISFDATTTNTDGVQMTAETSDASVASATVAADGTVTVTPVSGATGTATITVTSPSSTNYNEASKDFHLTVTNGFTYIVPGDDEVTYNGSAQSLSEVNVLSPSDATVKYGTSEGTYDLDAPPSYTNVGTYTVYFQITDADGNTETGSYALTIKPKTVTVTADDLSKTYGEGDPTLTATANGLVGSDTLSYSVTRAAGEDAGEYVATPSGDELQGNYKVTYKTGTFTIEKATPTITPSQSGYAIKYPESLSLDIASSNTDGCTLEWSLSNTDVAEATVAAGEGTSKASATLKSLLPGSTTLVVTSPETKNFKAATKKFYVTVSKGEIVYQIVYASEDEAITYDGKAHKPDDGVAVVVESPEGVFIEYGKEEGNYSDLTLDNYKYTEPGTYRIYFQLSKANYETVHSYFDFTIKPISVTPPEGTDFTYDGTQKTGVTATDSAYTLSGTTQATDAGTYTATATLTDTTHYSWSDGTTDPKTITWTIDKATPTVNLTPSSDTTTFPDAVTFTATTTNTDSDVKLSATVADASVVGISAIGDDGSVTVTPGKVGSTTVTITSSETTNYYEATATYTIQVFEGGMTVTPEDQTVTYNGSEQTPEGVTVTTPEDGATVTYGTEDGTYDSSSPMGYTDAGTYTIYYQVTADNYTTVTGSYTFTIEPKDIADETISVDPVDDQTWTGSEVTPSPVVTDSQTGKVLTEGVDYTLSYEDNVDEGTATITITGIGNYTGTRTVTFKIAKEIFTIVFRPNGGNWNGSTENRVIDYADDTTITIPEAPEREGYTFVEWRGSSYQPGDKYTVTEDHVFTAIWKKDATTTSKVKPAKGAKKTAVLPKMSDPYGNAPTTLVAVGGVLLAAGAAVVAIDRRRRHHKA